jgi:hypothetical protein
LSAASSASGLRGAGMAAMISVALRRGRLRAKFPSADEALLDGGDTSSFDPGKACGYDPDVPTGTLPRKRRSNVGRGSR